MSYTDYIKKNTLENLDIKEGVRDLTAEITRRMAVKGTHDEIYMQIKEEIFDEISKRIKMRKLPPSKEFEVFVGERKRRLFSKKPPQQTDDEDENLPVRPRKRRKLSKAFAAACN